MSTYEKDFKTGGAPGWLLFQTLLPLSLLSQELQYLEAEIRYFVTGKKKHDKLIIYVCYTFKPQFDFQVHLLFKLSSFFLSLPPCRSPLISDHFLNKGAEFVSLFWQIHCPLPPFFHIHLHYLLDKITQNQVVTIVFCNHSQKETLAHLYCLLHC